MKHVMKGFKNFIKEKFFLFFSYERIKFLGASFVLSVLLALNVALGIVAWSLYQRNISVDNLRRYMYTVIEKDDKVTAKLAGEMKYLTHEDALHLIEMSKEFFGMKYAVQNVDELVSSKHVLRQKMTLTFDKASTFSPLEFFDECSRLTFPLVRIEALDYDLTTRIMVAKIEIIAPYGEEE